MNDDAMKKFEMLQSEFWPARSIHHLNGWTVTEESGVTWRANSVFPYGTVQSERVDGLIDEVIDFYNQRGFPAAFKMTSACNPSDLDSRLDERGFEQRMLTHVQTLSLSREMFAFKNPLTLEIHPNVPEEWLDKQKVDARYQGQRLQILKDILNRIPGTKGFVLVKRNEDVLAVGLGVVHKEWLALFSIRVDPDERRQGIGGIISKALLNWGMENGAKNAFLQVETDNIPALALYKELGFETVYTYWYRILPFIQRESDS